MKRLITISLFIFAVVVVAILTAGLVFYQDKKVVQIPTDIITNNSQTGSNIVLNMQEISKHNKKTDCWMLISGKVYDVTSYFGQHPGGDSMMAPTCGTDATDAYKTRDPYAKTSGSRTAHSSNAKNLLNDYYIGDFVY